MVLTERVHNNLDATHSQRISALIIAGLGLVLGGCTATAGQHQPRRAAEGCCAKRADSILVVRAAVRVLSASDTLAREITHFERTRKGYRIRFESIRPMFGGAGVVVLDSELRVVSVMGEQ